MGKHKDCRHVHHRSLKKKDKSRSNYHEGSLKGAEEMVQAELESLANAKKMGRKERKDLERMPLLPKAVYLGCEQLVENILEIGENINAQVQGGKTPLIIAVENGYPGIVQKLLKKGADPKLLREDGRNALMIAVANNDNRSFMFLWNYWDKSNFGELNHRDSRGFTVLTIASEQGHTHLTNFLLRLTGVEIDRQTKEGKTPLMYSVVRGQTKTVEKFLASGSDVALEDKDGTTAICLAITKNEPEIKNLLIESLDRNTRDTYVKKRLELLSKPRKGECSEAVSFYKNTLFFVILEIRRGFDDGVELLKKHRVFEGLMKCLTRHQQDCDLLRIGFHLAASIMHDQDNGDVCVVEDLAEQYVVAKGADLALKVMHVYRVKNLIDLRGAAFITIHAGAQSPSGKTWLRTNFFQVAPFVKEFKKNFPGMTFWQEGESPMVQKLFDRFLRLIHPLEKELNDANEGNEMRLENPIPATQMVERNKSIGDLLDQQQWSVVSHSKSRTRKPAPALQTTAKKGTNRKNKTRTLRKETIKSAYTQPDLKYVPGLCTNFPSLQSDGTFSATGYADALKKNLQNENDAKSGREVSKDDSLPVEPIKANENVCSKMSYPSINKLGDWIINCGKSQSEKVNAEDPKPDNCLHNDKIKELELEDTDVLLSKVKNFNDSSKARKLLMAILSSKASVKETCDQRIQTVMIEEPTISLPQERYSKDGYNKGFPVCENFKQKCQGVVTQYPIQNITFKNSSTREGYQDGQPKKSHLQGVFDSMGFKDPPDYKVSEPVKSTTIADISSGEYNISSMGNGEEDKQSNNEYFIDAKCVKTDEKNFPDLKSSTGSYSMFGSNCSKISSETNVPFPVRDSSFDEILYNDAGVNNKRKYVENQPKNSLFIKKESISVLKDDSVPLESKANIHQSKSKVLKTQNDLTQDFHIQKESDRGDGCSKTYKPKWKYIFLNPEFSLRKRLHSTDNSESQSLQMALQELATIKRLESSSIHGSKKKLYSEITRNSEKIAFPLSEPNRETADENRNKCTLEIFNNGSFGDFKYVGKKSVIKNVLKSISLLSTIQKVKPIGIQKYIELYQRLILHELGPMCSLLPKTSMKAHASKNINHSHVSSKNTTIFSWCKKQREVIDLSVCDKRNIALPAIRNECDAVIKQKENFSKYTQALRLHTRRISKQINAIHRGGRSSKTADRKKMLSSGTTSPIPNSRSEVNFTEGSDFIRSSILHGNMPQFINCEPSSKWYSILRRIESCLPLASFFMGFGRMEARFPCDSSIQELVCSSGNVIFSTKEEHVLHQSDLGTYVGLMGNGNPVVVRQFKKSSQEAVKLLSKRHRIHHRNIAAFYCLCCSPKHQYYFAVTELVEYSLPEYLQVTKNFHGKILVQQLLEALRYLHRKQIVHGFLKPSNVMVTLDYRVKISDFYLLDVTCLQHGYKNQRNGKTPGATVNPISDYSWRPFELISATTAAEARKYLTAPSDIQMAGMLIYYILSGGKHPFGSSDAQCQENIIGGFPELNYPIDIESRDLITDMIKRVPSTRPIINIVTKHPYLWDIEKRFKFLIAVARKIEFFTRKLTKFAEDLQDSCIEARSWTGRVPFKFLKLMGQCTNRTLDDNFVDLLMFLVGVNDNFDTMPAEIKSLVLQPSVYVSRTFPATFMSVYSVVREHPVAQRQMAIQVYF